jgi:hypothetical protein
VPQKQFGEGGLIAAARRIHKLFVRHCHSPNLRTNPLSSLLFTCASTLQRERPPGSDPDNPRHRRVCLDRKS